MARIHPDGWRELAAAGTARREIETLEQLDTGLSEAYAVYHGVHWTRVAGDYAGFGEIDFAVVNPAGQVLLIVRKSGRLEETPAGLAKRHDQAEKILAVRMARDRDALSGRLKKLHGDAPPHVDGLLYCPDHTVKSPGTAGIDPSRIVDASQRSRLADRVRALLPEQAPASPLADKIHRFMLDELKLVPDVNAMVGQSRLLYTRLSGGLAHWARRIDCQPFRLRVVGTAGSGKTQLALALLRDAASAGRRALYVCYNRPLADHVARIAPAEATVATYHQLADRILRSTGHPPDFSQPGAFQRLETFMAALVPGPAWRFDELIVDEGQDFQSEWRDPLLRLLRENGRLWWLEDPLQNLYGRPPVHLDGAVTLRADTNYRSPKDILAFINRLLGPSRAAETGSPLAGAEVEILEYANPAELIERTKSAITRALGAGFKKEAIALVTYRGREHSQFTPLDRLGPHPLKAFTGTYDLFGGPIHRDGDLYIDSVYRFKGQSAPCVIFTEIDFTDLDEVALRKLFVGMTRATMKLLLVVSSRAAKSL